MHIGGVSRTLRGSHVRTRRSLDPRVVRGACKPFCLDRFAYEGGLGDVSGQGDIIGMLCSDVHILLFLSRLLSRVLLI